MIKRPPKIRETAAKIIYRDLKADIVAMRLLPGTAINEKSFSEQFGVSRTPVREAILRLAEDGLIDVFPQSGTFVARIPLERIPESVVIRQALESTAVEHAALSAGNEEIDKLDELITLQQFHASREKLSLFHEADDAFHETIAEISGFPGIWQHLKLVKIQIDRARRMTVPVLGRMDQVLREHKYIRDAIAAKDATEAAKAMKQHLSAVLPDIDELRKTHPDFFI
ncbi:GntR family transcriptional regulator [Brucellaceae bacterium C25G]